MIDRKRKGILFFADILLLLTVVSLAGAQNIAGNLSATPPEDSRVCVGYLPDRSRWGSVGPVQYTVPEEYCPPGYAYLAVNEVAGKHRDAASLPVWGSCCPVPKDLLTEEHVFELEECPEDYIGTGGKGEPRPAAEQCRNDAASCEKEWTNARQYIRCTKINVQRYMLSQAKAGLALGWSRHFSSAFQDHTTRSRLPAAIRFGIARADYLTWEKGGCVGYPFGSVFVKKESKYCRGLFFRQVLYRGAPGDPSTGTPVQMFPACEAIDDPLSPTAACR